MIEYNNLTEALSVDGNSPNPPRAVLAASGDVHPKDRNACRAQPSAAAASSAAPQPARHHHAGESVQVSGNQAPASSPEAITPAAPVAAWRRTPAEVLRQASGRQRRVAGGAHRRSGGIARPNGAGKTTSFYMIVGLLRASSGDITIDGQSIEHMPIHRRARLGLGYLPQEMSIFRASSMSKTTCVPCWSCSTTRPGQAPGTDGNRAPPERLVARPARGPFARLPGAGALRRRASAGGDSPRWPRGRVSSCWMSPLRVSTPLP